MINTRIQFDSKFTLTLIISPQTTVYQLIQLAKLHGNLYDKVLCSNKNFQCLISKNSSAVADLWLINHQNILKPFGKKAHLKAVYKNISHYKTQIKNYVRIQKLANFINAVRDQKDSKVYVLRQYSKQLIDSFNKMQAILIIKQTLIKFRHVHCLPRLYKTFESKYSFNLLLQLVPFKLQQVANKENIKLILVNFLKSLQQLQRIGVDITQININDFNITFELNFKLVKLSHLLSIKSKIKFEYSIGYQFYRIIHQCFKKLGILSSQFQTQQSFKRVQFFLGTDFKKFMITLKQKEINNINQILNMEWLFGSNRLNYQCSQFKYYELNQELSQTSRNEFDDVINFNFKPVQQKFQNQKTQKKKAKKLSIRSKTKRFKRQYFGCPYSKIFKII